MGSIFYHQSGYFQIDSKVALDLDNSMYLAKLWICLITSVISYEGTNRH